MGHDVFLSYSRKDKATMQRLRDGLRSAGITVWTDENLQVGTPAWEKAIQEAIEDTVFLIALLSPEAKESKWVNKEISYADSFGKTIIPVLVKIGNKEIESIPIRLVDYQYANLVNADVEEFVLELAGVLKQARLPSAETPSEPSSLPLPPSLTAASPRKKTSRPSASPRSAAPWGGTGRAGSQELKRIAAEWEKQRQENRAKSAAKIDQIRKKLPDAPVVRPWHPLDQLRLLWWMLRDPDKVYAFQYKTPYGLRLRAGAWLLSTLGHLILLILTLAAVFGWLPVEDDLLGFPRFILPVIVVASWALTGLLAALVDDSFSPWPLMGGCGVGLIGLGALVGGVHFVIVAVAVALLDALIVALVWDEGRAGGFLIFILGFGILGIAGRMLHLDPFRHTPLLAGLGLPASLLLLVALCIGGGIAASIINLKVFQHHPGEDEREYAPWLADNGLVMWIIGIGFALLICIILVIGSTAAVKTNQDVTQWIADRLPEAISGMSPHVKFPTPSGHGSFSLADVSHGLVAGWTTGVTGMIAGGIILGVALLVQALTANTINASVEQRKTSRYGIVILALFALSILLLIVVPPLSS